MTMQHELILASAGTGKTFQLTNRYLQLLDAGADPGTILATTFTRKAAGEIRDRVLGRLAAAIEDDKELDTLRKHVRATLTRDDCVALLAKLVRDLHRLNVRTLDAFFLRAATAFQLELDAPPGWGISTEDETAALQRAAIEDALDAGDAGELFALLSMLFQGAAKFSVHDQLARVVREAYAIWRRARDPRAWQQVQPTDEPLSEADLADLLVRAETMPLARTKKGETNGHWVRAHTALLEKLRAGADPEALLASGFVKMIAEGGDGYRGTPFEAEALAVLEPLARHAGAVIVARIADRNLALHALLGHFHAAFELRKRRAAAYGFDDVPQLLLAAEAEAQLETLYYRLDATCQHLLLDEFQDTSKLQFDLLYPLVDQVLATAPPERSFYCVGDEKQSLYGWRNADPELLPSLPGLWPGRMHVGKLDESYRSAPVVLDAVNTVFDRLDARTTLQPYPLTLRIWKDFPEHSSARKELGGAVRLVAARPEDRADDADPKRTARLNTTVDRVRRLLDAAPNATVGILVRKAKDIPWLVHALREASIDAAREGGSTLLDSSAVAAAVAALVFADHPDHGIARYHVAASALGPMIGVTDPLDDDTARAAAAALRTRFADEGHAEVLADWHRRGAEAMTGRDFHRFGQLVALAEECADVIGLRSSRLARIVRERRVPEPDVAPVRVMTIHASKGLEFDAVVLPQLDERWTVRDQVVHHRGADGTPDAVSYKPGASVRELSPRLKDIYEDCAQRQFSEELCCLYVAMTRARHVLEMIVLAPEGKKARKGNPGATPKPSELLLEAFGVEPDAEGETEVWWERTAGDWVADVAREHAGASAPQAAPRRTLEIRPPDRIRLDRAPRRSPSGLEGGTRIDLARRLRVHAPDARRRGAVMHAWFAAIEWLDAGPPSADALAALARHEGATDAEIAAWRPEFLRALDQEGVQETLRRPATGTCTVHCERRFAVRDEDDRDGSPVLLTGAFDRVVVEQRDGAPRAISIVDFKTDAVDDTTRDDRVEHYRPQMEAYRRAAARLWNVGAERVSVTLLFTETGTRVDV